MIPSKTKVNPNIIVLFKSRSARNQFYSCRNKLKTRTIADIGFTVSNDEERKK